jgi:hypothetical protein
LIARAAGIAALAALLQTGCRQLLGIPDDPSAVDGGDSTESDARPDSSLADASHDAAPPCANRSVSIDFDDPDELDRWDLDLRRGCTISIEEGRFAVHQIDPPGFCRAFRDLSLEMVELGLQIQVADPGNDQLSLVYSVILDDGNDDIRQRRRLRIERDGGEIKLGECTAENCDTTRHGSFPYDPAAHTWWRIGHYQDTRTVHFEFASQTEQFSEPDGAMAVTGISDDMVRCVGVELATYEPSDLGTAAFDFLAASSNGG